MNPVFDVLRLLSEESDDFAPPREMRGEKITLLPEAQVEQLLQLQKAYAKGCPFKPGDVVTPKRGTTINNQGEPHVVLAVFDTSDYDKTNFLRIDIRVVCFASNEIVTAFLGESWNYEFHPLNEQKET